MRLNAATVGEDCMVKFGCGKGSEAAKERWTSLRSYVPF